ncbi:MAG TPA: hypothetical protein VGB79_10395 [Allosphingosinicella sp.]
MGDPAKRYENNAVTADVDDHQWAVVLEACDLEALDDGMLRHAVDAIRAAYGEQEILDLAENEPLLRVPDPAEGIGNFETDHLIQAFRSSLPNPDAEGNKPAHLTNYRSETTEIIAREALSAVFDMATPPALHATKGNRNQPILGFDGWSVMNQSTGELALVLIQVKGTDDPDRPPSQAEKLIVECGEVTAKVEKLKGFLVACALRCKGTAFCAPLLNMLVELETTAKVANLVVAPVIIRGLVEADLDDLKSLREATGTFGHAKARGMSLSIGADLNKFGRKAMDSARQHD